MPRAFDKARESVIIAFVLPPWWNWYTRQVEGLCPYRACPFESGRGHHQEPYSSGSPTLHFRPYKPYLYWRAHCRRAGQPNRNDVTLPGDCRPADRITPVQMRTQQTLCQIRHESDIIDCCLLSQASIEAVLS